MADLLLQWPGRNFPDPHLLGPSCSAQCCSEVMAIMGVTPSMTFLSWRGCSLSLVLVQYRRTEFGGQIDVGRSEDGSHPDMTTFPQHGNLEDHAMRADA